MSEREPEQSDAIAAARAKANQLATDFEAQFGQPRKRTPAQKRVFDHLESCAGSGGNIFQFLGDQKDGLAIGFAAAQRDGAQILLRVINRQLAVAAKSREPKKAKPSVTKR